MPETPPARTATVLPPHVKVFSPVAASPFPCAWYDLSSLQHFWFRWRFLALQQLMSALKLDRSCAARAFDIGCGSGLLQRQLESATAWNVDGTDLNVESLVRCLPGRGDLLYYDITQRHAQLHERYDQVFLFDTLEHVEQTRPFLECVLWHLKPGGYLFINVPALSFLFSAYDTAAGHYRRYSKATLHQEFEGLNFDVLDVRYWGFMLVPLLMARKLVVNAKAPATSTLIRGFKPPHAALNWGFSLCARLETSVLRRPPLGASVMLAGRKR